MARHGYEAGVAVLSQVRNGDVTAEAWEVKHQIEVEAKVGQVSYIEFVKNPSLRKRVCIACWLQIGQQFTGFNTILMYAATMFTEMGFSDPFAPNMAFQGFQVFSIMIGLLLIDSKYGGRRSQLLVVTMALIPILVLIGGAVAFHWPLLLELVLVASFGFVWEMAWGPIPWIYPSEIFSMSERDRATSLAVFCQYGANAVLMFIVPRLKSSLGVSGMFWFHAAFNIVNFIVAFLYIKETKGVLLEDVPGLFSAKKVAKSIKGKQARDVEDSVGSPCAA